MTGRGFAAALADHGAGRLDAAAAGYRAVLADDPGHPDANNNLAILLRAAGRPDEAAAHYRRALDARPEDPQIRTNLACTLADQGRVAAALATVRRALALDPGFAGAWFNAGTLHGTAGDTVRAMAAYRRALTVNPAMGEAHSNLGDAHRDRDEGDLAIASYAAAIRAQPSLPQPFVNLGETLKELGRVSEALQVLQQGREHHPGLALLHSNLLLALHYAPWVPPEVVHRAHVHWNDCHARALGRGAPGRGGRLFANDRRADRRLRVGYVSPDFREHACAHFIEPLLRAHDRAAVEVVCYSATRHEDATTGRMRALADRWRPLAGVPDDAAAVLVEADGIDILVDLAGHTADGRPLLFARKPAPVQVAWLGYPATTGMPAVDCRLTDAVADPEGVTDRWHAEALVRLPHGFLAYQPPPDAPPPGPPPALANGHVTFGSFNNAAKTTPEVIRVWAALLARVPGSRLVLKSRANADADARARLLHRFAGHGVAPERIALLAPTATVAGHLGAYGRIDVALDPFPYTGTTTTCEALWMGVPVVTLAGRSHVARVGASLLTRAGLPGLIATDEAGYIDTAAALASDVAGLGALRRDLRGRLQRSPLADHAGFARAVEHAYRTMWRDWLRRAPPAT